MTAPRRRRGLLAWQHGAGRGHVVKLAEAARALSDRYEFTAALCRMDHAAELAGLADPVIRGASLRFDDSARRVDGRVVHPTATWGEFMGDLGFRDAAFLSETIAWWQDLLLGQGIELVVADYAPMALLAARSMGIPSVLVGTGYAVPADGIDSFPVYLPQITARVHDEGAMVRVLNEVGWPLGLPPIRALPEVYAADEKIVTTLPMLDPYDGLRSRPPIPPVTDPLPAPGATGQEVFVYFSTREAQENGALAALAALARSGRGVRGFFPGLAEDARAALSAAGVMVEPRPVPAPLIAQRSAVMLHAGQHGILSLGLLLGLPQVALPQHLEHYYHAWRAGQQGVLRLLDWSGRDAASTEAALRDVLADRAMARRARALAAGLIADGWGDGTGALAARLAHL